MRCTGVVQGFQDSAFCSQERWARAKALRPTAPCQKGGESCPSRRAKEDDSSANRPPSLQRPCPCPALIALKYQQPNDAHPRPLTS